MLRVAGGGGTTATRAWVAAWCRFGSNRTAYVARRRGVTTVTVADPEASRLERRTNAVRPATCRNTRNRSPAAVPWVTTEIDVALPPTSAESVNAGTILT